MKQTPYVLVDQALLPENISITLSHACVPLDQHTEQRITEVWTEKIIESKQRGKEIFNGTSYRVIKWSFNEGHLSLELGVFDYKHLLGIISLIKAGELAATTDIQGGCFVGATVCTADNQYVLVQLSGKSMNDNTYDMLGGIAETDVPLSTDGSYLFATLYKELEEEAGITQSDISDCQLRLFFAGTSAHYGFHFSVTISLTEKQLTKRFRSNADEDIAALCFFDKPAYIKKIESLSPNKKLFVELLKED